jgi:large subunit ribosomal protein L4
MPTVQILDGRGQPAGTAELRPEVFGVEVRVPLLHQAVTRELADRRAGTHDTKGRSEVSGGGKKPWKQKGTGRARQGSTRAPQWKGGGKPFGPTPRSYQQQMPRQMRRAALRGAVAACLRDGEVTVIEALPTPDGKTRSLVRYLRGLGLQAVPTLLVVAARDELVWRAARNVSWLIVETPSHVSVYELLRARQVVFERAGLLALEEALAS